MTETRLSDSIAEYGIAEYSIAEYCITGYCITDNRIIVIK